MSEAAETPDAGELEPEPVAPAGELEPDAAEPEPEPEPEPETPEPAAEPQVHMTEREMEQGRKRIDRAAAKYREVLSETLGEEGNLLLVCANCAEHFPGYVFPPAIAPVTETRRSATFAQLGVGDPTELRQADFAAACEQCNGYGEVLTGSRNNMHAKQNCRACMGKGWRDLNPGSAVAGYQQANGQPPEPPAPVAEPAPEVDFMGRRPDHPDYGKMPLYSKNTPPGGYLQGPA